MKKLILFAILFSVCNSFFAQAPSGGTGASFYYFPIGASPVIANETTTIQFGLNLNMLDYFPPHHDEASSNVEAEFFTTDGFGNDVILGDASFSAFFPSFVSGDLPIISNSTQTSNFGLDFSLAQLSCLPTGTYFIGVRIKAFNVFYFTEPGGSPGIMYVSVGGTDIFSNTQTAYANSNSVFSGPTNFPDLLEVNLTNSTTPLFSVLSTPSDCNFPVSGNGTASISVTGGFPAFSYLWTPTGQTTSTAVGLSPGTYSVTVTDGNGCARNFSTTVAPPFPDILPHTIGTGTTEIWTGNKRVLGTVIVDAGGTLNITNANIEFIYDATGTNAGIIVNKKGTLLVDNSTLTGCSDHIWEGIRVFGNHMIAQNTIPLLAEHGKVTIQGTPGFPSVIKNARTGILSVKGGIIEATSSMFVNNFRGAELKSYCFDPHSFFSDCDFIYNSSCEYSFSPGNEMIFVRLLSGTGCRFFGNRFHGNVSNNFEERGTGIKSDFGQCKIMNSTGGPGNNIFNDLSYGVVVGESYLTQSLVCIGNTFNDCQNGIFVKNGYLDLIKGNEFNLPSSGTASQGIFMLQSTGYSIFSNIFQNSLCLPCVSPSGTRAMVFENAPLDYTPTTGTYKLTGGVVYDNTINYTYIGVQAQKNNLNLKIRCNKFAAEPEAVSWAAINPPIGNSSLKQQGLDCADDPNPAGNEWQFTSTSTSFCPNSKVFADAGVTFKYFAHILNENADPFTNPTDGSTAVWSGSGDLEVCLISKTPTSCDDPSAGGMIPQLGFDDYISQKQSDIITNKELAVQNPSLEIYYMGEAQLAEHEIIRQYSYRNDIASLKEVLLGSTFLESKIRLAEIYLNENNLNACAALVSELSQETSDEAIHFSNLMNIRLALANENKPLDSLSQEQVNALRTIAQSQTLTSGIAEVILEAVKGETFDHPIFPLPTGPEMRLAKQTNEQLSDAVVPVTFVNISPNPAKQDVTVNFILPFQNKNSELTVCNMIGSKVYSQIINQQTGEIKIPVSNLENGIYHFSLVSKGEKLTSQKLVVIH